MSRRSHPAPRAASVRAYESYPDPAPAAPLRVLLLEDDEFDADLILRALRTAGYEVEWTRVETEDAFRASLAEVPYDVILSDYSLPAFDGLAALQILRDRGLDVPFILVSGALGEEAAIESLKLGATDYVLKDRLDRLAPVVRRALKDHEARRERARAEQALRESEERYRGLVDSARDIIFTIAPDGTFTSLNPAFESVLRWSRADWIGKPFGAIIHPEDRAAAAEIFARLQRGIPAAFELRVLTAAGDHVVAEFVAALQPQRDNTAAVLGVARDVTARKRAEAKMRTLVDIAKDLTGTYDLRAVLPRVEERTATALPCDVVATFLVDPEAQVARLVSHHGLGPEQRAAAAGLAFRPNEPTGGALGEGNTVVVDDVRDGPIADACRPFGIRAVVAAPLRSRNRHFGVLLAANTTARPFDRDQIEFCEAVARQVAGAMEASDLYRVLQEDAEVASALARVGQELISSVDLPVLLDRLCRVTAEALQCDLSHVFLMRDDENSFVPMAGYGETAEPWEVLREVKVPRAALSDILEELQHRLVVQVDPSTYGAAIPPGLMSAYGISAGLLVALRRGQTMVGALSAGYRHRPGPFSAKQERIARGIAQLASLAIENARLVDQLEQANRLKSDFLATMSHELRTPLNVIIGYNELMLDEVFGTLSPEQTASLDRVGTSARELLELINATLDLSRLETGRAALNLQEVDPAVLIREVEAETRALREKPGVDFVWRVAPELPLLYSDGVKLKVLLKNLIANAVKFTDQGSVTVSVGARDGWLEVDVSDTGIGMSRETQAVIFEPFRQGDSSMTRRHGGVGLGLYIVSRLLALLSGRIEVQSELGRGTTFRVWVPLDAPPAGRAR